VEAYDLIRITLLGCLDQAESQVVALGLQQAKELIRTTRFEVQEIGR
jgi:hypothetical protein